MTNQEIGILGENAAADFLIKNGYVILERNYRVNHLEIDIIALKEGMLVFVEVKTRAADYLVAPQEAVNKQKQKFIINAANGYIRHHKRSEEARLDVITVLHKAGKIVSVNHIENAYYPTVRSF
ncbi:MAG: YraN family protein [Bacteroidales bacterium]|nr:YraN family protein [Bacteroidales bacterium]